MMRKVLYAAAGLAWFVLVFLVGIWITFPGETVAERLMWEWNDKVSEDIRLELGTVGPAPLFGAKAKDVALYSVKKDRRRRARDGEEEEPPEVREMLSFDALVVKVGPLSLLQRSPHITGTASMGDGDIDFDLSSSQDEEGAWLLRQAVISADGFPISAIPPIQGTELGGTGTVDMDIDLDAAEGLGESNGTASVKGRDLALDIKHPLLEGFELGAIAVQQIDLVFDVNQGRARVKRGTLASSVADVEIEGDILLNDALDRTRFRLKLVISLSEEFEMFKSFLKEAEWSDGTFHYSLSGSLDRLRFRPDRERRSRPRAERERGLDASEERIRPRSGRTAEELEEAREERRRRREERLSERKDRLGDRPEAGPRRPGTQREPEEPLDPEEEYPEETDLPPEDDPQDASRDFLPDNLAIPQEDFEDQGYDD